MTAQNQPHSDLRKARGRPRDWHDKTAQNTIKSLDRAMAVFEFLSEAQGKTLSALSSDMGQSPATVYRILITLEGRGLVEFDQADQVWHIGPQADKEITVHYQYYANQLDAGGTYIDTDQWYINPCTCCMYVEGREHEPHEINLEVPDDFALAGGWEPTGPHSWSAHENNLRCGNHRTDPAHPGHG